MGVRKIVFSGSDSAFCLNDHIPALFGVSLQEAAEAAFGVAAAVDIGVIEMIDAPFKSGENDLIHLFFGVPGHSHTAE